LASTITWHTVEFSRIGHTRNPPTRASNGAQHHLLYVSPASQSNPHFQPNSLGTFGLATSVRGNRLSLHRPASRFNSVHCPIAGSHPLAHRRARAFRRGRSSGLESQAGRRFRRPAPCEPWSNLRPPRCRVKSHPRDSSHTGSTRTSSQVSTLRPAGARRHRHRRIRRTRHR
jgi:hypothetical protein